MAVFLAEAWSVHKLVHNIDRPWKLGAESEAGHLAHRPVPFDPGPETWHRPAAGLVRSGVAGDAYSITRAGLSRSCLYSITCAAENPPLSRFGPKMVT